jgi:DNA-binding MarR family transcriptional regulator
LNTIETADHEFALLESIYRHKDSHPVRQRDLAKVVGISLGMTNVILRKLAQKGWLVARKINSRNIQYAVTSAGMEEIGRRSYHYLKRTVRNVVDYKDALEQLLVRAKERNFRVIALVGRSDFDFILSYLCQKHKLSFIESETPTGGEETLMVFAEDTAYSPRGPETAEHPRWVHIQDILIGR